MDIYKCLMKITKYEIMFRLVKNVCAIENICGKLVCNSKGSIKVLSLSNRPCQAKSTLYKL